MGTKNVVKISGVDVVIDTSKLSKTQAAAVEAAIANLEAGRLAPQDSDEHIPRLRAGNIIDSIAAGVKKLERVNTSGKRMNAKFPGQCFATGCDIAAGAPMVYFEGHAYIA